MDELKANKSEESISSNIFHWHDGHTRQVPVPRIETGREVKAPSFFLCLIGVLLLCSGLLLLGTSIWTIIYRIPYTYLTNKSIPFYITDLNICSGSLGIICSWIIYTSHNNYRRYIFLQLLIIMLSLSLIIISISGILSAVDRAKMSFEENTNKLLPGQFKTYLNESMQTTIPLYSQSQYKNAWDKVQIRLNCCGIDGSNDWDKNQQEIPKSCYMNGFIKSRGCIDALAYANLWQINLSTGFMYIIFGLQAIALLVVAYLYILNKINAKSRMGHYL